MGSPAHESGPPSCQSIDGLLSEQDRVAGGLGELLHASRDVDGVPDRRELELASPTEDGEG